MRERGGGGHALGGVALESLLKAVQSESHCATASCLALCSVASDMLLN